jgi:hypothetical protein
LLSASEPFRGHADDGETLARHLNRFADDGWVTAKAPLPETVTDDDHRIGAGILKLVFSEGAAQMSLDP